MAGRQSRPAIALPCCPARTPPARELQASRWHRRSRTPSALETSANIKSTVAVVRGDSNVKGTVTFEQENESGQTTISWNLTGNDANAERGMHVHAFGDNTNGCTSAGPHCKFPSLALAPAPPSPPLATTSSPLEVAKTRTSEELFKHAEGGLH